MAGNRLRVDRASIENNVDGTRGNVGTNRTHGEDVNNRQNQRINSREGGIGSDELSRQKASTNRHTEDVNTGVERTSNRTSEQASQFLAQARASANRSITST